MADLTNFFDEEKKEEVRVPGQWYKTKSGKGYSQYNPEMEKHFLERNRDLEKQYIMSCYLYYHGPENSESPLPDEEFDRIQVVLQHSPEILSDYFKSKTDIKDLKGSGHYMEYTEQEELEALNWYQDWHERKK